MVAGTIVSGSLNSILTKYQDMQCVKNCLDLKNSEYFDQPVLQTLQMFIGELLCWIPLIILRVSGSKKSTVNEREPLIGESSLVDRRRPTWKDSIILAIPSTCDLLGTTLMNIGLLYTPVSIYQMTRGAVILIIGLMSVVFLKKKITKLEWISLFVVFLGVFLVGFSGYISDQNGSTESIDSNLDIVFGMLIIFLGITMTAAQFVVEEHILSYLEVKPMEVVGYEGLYGSTLTLLGMTFGYLVYGKGMFDVFTAFRQMLENSNVLYSSIAIMFCISIFNFCGITLTSILSATSRSTIDTSRTLLVWMISLLIGWEGFHGLQLLAFGLLVGGTLSFNGVIQPEGWNFVPGWLKDLELEAHI